MRALVGSLIVATALATGWALRTAAAEPAAADATPAKEAGAGPQTKAKPVQRPTKGKRTKTTIPPRRVKKG
jgi:hypothetical protein